MMYTQQLITAKVQSKWSETLNKLQISSRVRNTWSAGQKPTRSTIDIFQPVLFFYIL